MLTDPFIPARGLLKSWEIDLNKLLLNLSLSISNLEFFCVSARISLSSAIEIWLEIV